MADASPPMYGSPISVHSGFAVVSGMPEPVPMVEFLFHSRRADDETAPVQELRMLMTADDVASMLNFSALAAAELGVELPTQGCI